MNSWRVWPDRPAGYRQPAWAGNQVNFPWICVSGSTTWATFRCALRSRQAHLNKYCFPLNWMKKVGRAAGAPVADVLVVVGLVVVAPVAVALAVGAPVADAQVAECLVCEGRFRRPDAQRKELT